MIKPTIGRVVLFHPAGAEPNAQPWPALICHVYSDTSINVGGFDKRGRPFGETEVELVQDSGHGVPSEKSWCEWMPYQKAVAEGKLAPTLHAEPEKASKTGKHATVHVAGVEGKGGVKL